MEERMAAGEAKTTATDTERKPTRTASTTPLSHHNSLLQDALHELRSKHPGAAATTTVVYADLFRPVMEMVES
uniref:Uncharacterized protein n=1 Tax=Oryza rufipogon TaxID=4529 RepID=A0A0E0MT95_ORYRU